MPREMQLKEHKQIGALCAAQPGWWAVFSDEEPGRFGVLRVAVWAAVHEPGDGPYHPLSYVDGVDLEGSGACGSLYCEVRNFMEYVYLPDATEEEVERHMRGLEAMRNASP